MSLSPAVIDGFAGLDFRPDRVGESTSALVAHNVLIHSPGRVRRRPFTRYLLNTAFSSAPAAMHCASGNRLLATEGTNLRAVDTSSGSVVATQGGLATNQAYYVNVASPTLTHTVIATGGTIYRFDHSADTFATPTFTGVTPSGGLAIGLTPWDSRVAYAVGSRLYFSDPGVPYTVQTNNYVDLAPGDGTSIISIEAWREYLFVFKGNKFFVFYGTSTDSRGNPVFNYRPVVTCGVDGTEGTIAHRTGVYFVSGGSMYRTTGGEPEDVSLGVLQAVAGGDGLYNSPVQQGATFPVWQMTNLGADDRFVYAALSGVPSALQGTVPGSLVYDTLYGNWTTSSFTAAASSGGTNSGHFASTQRSSPFGPSLYVGLPDKKQIQVYSHTVDFSPLHDNGAGSGNDPRTVDAHYWTGWLDLGPAGSEKVIRDTEIVGQGRVKQAWRREFVDAVPSYSPVLQLGVANQGFSVPPVNWNRYGLDRKRTGVAAAGELFQLCLSNTGDASAYFEIHRVGALMRSAREAGQAT